MSQHATCPAEGPVMIALGSRLPTSYDYLVSQDHQGAFQLLAEQLVIFFMPSPSPHEINAFGAEASFAFRQWDYTMMTSWKFKGPAACYDFELVWDPSIAVEKGEPLIRQHAPGEHCLFTLILMDENRIIRAIRQSTLSAACSAALVYAQGELYAKQPTRNQVTRELGQIYLRFPKAVDDEFFTHRCQLGD